ncbi:MAG TPA: flagellar hook capping FlgD N-terminal domain-containing protein [Anaeromyxobacter sp.]|nr:flagellar hook capping FlgD N-terminal domain-containing protein [Anaeromyxobacter sp.]
MDTVISSLSSLPQVSDGLTTSTTSTASNDLGKDAFLKLLTTQLQNQDPLNPTDDKEWIAQLAQFSSLEQLQNLGTKLDSLVTGQSSSTELNATSLVGKQVLFNASKVGLVQGSTSAFQVALDVADDSTSAVLADSTGRVVRSLPLGARDAGTFSVTWDGLDDNGQPLPSGNYFLTVAGTRKDGTPVSAQAQIRATVTGVTLDGQTPELVVAGQHLQLSDILEIDSASP